jgi:hypothetical protein
MMTDAEKRQAQHQCAMSALLLRAMAKAKRVRVGTTSGDVVGVVESTESHKADQPVEEIDGAQFIFVIAGKRVHLATVTSVGGA